MSNTQQPFAPPMSRGPGGLEATVIVKSRDGKISQGVSRSFNVNGTTISQNVLLNGVNHEVTLKGVTSDQIEKLKSGAASIVVDTDGNNGKIVENSFAGEPTRKHRLEDLWRMNVRLRDQLPLDLTRDPGFPKGYGFDDLPDPFMVHTVEYKNGVRKARAGETWTPSPEWLAAAKKRHNIGGGRTHRLRFLRKHHLAEHGYSLGELAKISKVPQPILRQVYDRGIGAYKTNPTSVRMKGTFRKGVKAPYSKKLSKEQWAMARVYSFLDGNPKHDTDLRRKTRRRHK